jgi:dienelactone hydrolase
MPLIALLLAASAAAAPAPPAQQRVSFRTNDGWTIAADYRPPPRGGTVVILAHGVGSSKSEWARLTARLAADGIGTLALDLRGHADSRKGPRGKRGYETFDEHGEWPKAARDLTAAADWLRRRGVAEKHIGFGGASIGANLAAAAALRRRCRTFLLLLSPGLDYHGVALALPPDAKILVAAAPTDEYADRTMLAVAKARNVETFEAPAGHGVQMLEDPPTFERVARWLEGLKPRE